MKKLTINEQIFLIAIWHLGDRAYGINIKDKITDLTGNKILFGTLYNTLDHLARKGFVTTERKNTPAGQGGNNRVYYSLTKPGLRALQEARNLQNNLWNGLPGRLFSEKD
ncbi:MAG: PadR family transcriptional regulator [Candidatus Aminicenantes bacterium]|nr:PadR family transcriptional regulator [Candidatus Aminicenantes bacterium]